MQKGPDACFNILHLIMLVSKISKEHPSDESCRSKYGKGFRPRVFYSVF